MVLKKIRALLARGSKRIGSADQQTPENAAAPPHPAAAPAVHRGPEVVHHPVALQDLDPDAVRIVRRLTRFDFAAYLVGGCVRDLLLDRKPKDFDIATSATPRQVKRLFSNCRIIGRRFRLAHVYFQNGKIIEVATFRARDGADVGSEAAESDTAAPPGEETVEDLLIRDDNVFGSPEEDALRRDFTVNALFYDVNAETVIDHADGLGDLRRRLVRTIGDPTVRFREDPIRILRAIKFAARLDFQIEPATLAALRLTRTEIPKAAAPRILEEFNRFCRSGAGRKSFELAFATGVFEVILPELAAIYRDAGPERKALLTLLDAIDARWNGGREVYAGEIFSALLFAAVAPALGWPLDPKVRAPKDGRDARAVIDEALRPIALRLRIARKDQEHVRQTLTTLQRMLPAKPMRRGAKLALMRRPAFDDAMAILRALAPSFEGDFAAARGAWEEIAAGHQATSDTGAEVHVPAESADDLPAAGEGRRGKRRRGRRGGRGRRKDREGELPATTGPAPIFASAAAAAAAAPAPPSPPAAPRGPKLPPVWDDNYFFAALPSVPSPAGGEDDADGGRYAEGVVEVAEAGEQRSPAARKRRRGGRRRRKGGPAGSTPSPEGEPA